MSQKREPQQPVPGKLTINRRFLRRGKHSALLFLPDTYHAHIGLIIAHWGQFEHLFDKFLEGLIRGEKADNGTRQTEGWEGSEFKRRRELFKAICQDWLLPWQAKPAKVLIDLCATAGDLRWQRDMIAHGTYAYTIPPMSSHAVNCRAVNERTGQVMPFDEHTLTKLHHDIAHLAADMLLTFKEFSVVENDWVVTLPDTQLLELFRETNRRFRAEQDKKMPRPTAQPK